MTETTTTTQPVGVPVVLAISHKRIADLLTTAMENPVGSWIIRVGTTPVEDKSGLVPTPGNPHYSQGAYWTKPDAALRLTVENPVRDNNGLTLVKTLRMEDFQNALILMATKDDGTYSHHFADFLRSNEDANTADLFMQLAVYGEEVFA